MRRHDSEDEIRKRIRALNSPEAMAARAMERQHAEASWEQIHPQLKSLIEDFFAETEFSEWHYMMPDVYCYQALLELCQKAHQLIKDDDTSTH